jgi:tetratricopeptide (TPR) repeat protein
MLSMRVSAAIAICLAVLGMAPVLLAQEHASVPDPEAFNTPIPLYTSALGSFTYPISTRNPQAQAYFDQGFQMMYSFTKVDAARSFREAQRLDPDCAICYWGEAWAWGSYLNGPMGAQDSPRAYGAIREALRRLNNATEKEADMIMAMSVRYVANFTAARRMDQERAYAEAMGELAAKYPDDLDIVTLYGDALFLLEPRRGTRDLNDPNVIRLHNVLTSVLERDIRHPGACHLYVHATESTSNPGLAEECAQFLGTSIPGASHINHMPSHTWNEIGRWNDSVRANIMAWHSDQKAAIGEGFAIYPMHNLAMLVFSASMDGQGAIAIQAGKDYEKLMNSSIYHVLTLIRFGRFDEVAAIDRRPQNNDFDGGAWDFAQGYAALKMGDMSTARDYLGQLETLAQDTTDNFRFHDGNNLLTVLAEILDGEIARSTGDMNNAIASFERATEAYNMIMYDEPEPLPFSAKHWLGAAYIEVGQFERAIMLYEEDLREHPHNGWALFGIKQALAAQGLSDPDIDERFEKAWERSDTWIVSSRF